ncbi:2-hydroxyacid dehydrogenase [Acetohalobium arabaticum]|uniref:Phosphoglycerate dehydrogenase n=1 Tax=Acetohalobium arabaticum (strain ATCC 49924 / DSM 5501 / Z-7288) TaxID=574087 RepID=D9QS48_ACEAZ|nr:2-hydroxyacid dehydrogenase [Acetohalobium arabaticum]ADL13339.1 Phosphoglycerate dehydrogenase [Acetohalobium arabaticum DSM 5501]
MKIVMLEPLAVKEEIINELKANLEEQDHEFVAYDNRIEDEDVIIDRASEADALIITNLPLSERVIEACSNLKLISVAFTGVDHIDLEACQKQGVTVCNAPGYSTHSVAELAIGFMITVMRNMVPCDVATRKGKTRTGLIGNELKGKKLGIIGTGSIGLRVAEIGKVFGCELLGYNRSEKEQAKELGLEYVNLDTLMKESDIISLHLPHTEETKGMIDKEKISLMKESSIFINVARGPIVDNEALAAALKEGHIAGAGIDVFEMEPPIPQDHPLLNAPNTVVTPHVAFATPEAFYRRANTVFDNIESWLQDNPQNVMN